MDEDIDYEYDEWAELPNFKLPKSLIDDEAMNAAIKDIKDDNKGKTSKNRKPIN